MVEGLSARQIAGLIFSSKTAVLESLERFGIPIREPHYNHGNPSQTVFGKKVHHGRLIEDKVEKRVIKIILELHEQGLSLRKIAKCLNQMEFATKNRSWKWNPEMIRRVLSRNWDS